NAHRPYPPPTAPTGSTGSPTSGRPPTPTPKYQRRAGSSGCARPAEVGDFGVVGCGVGVLGGYGFAGGAGVYAAVRVAGVPGAHAGRLADDLDVVDGQFQVAGDLGDDLGRAHAAAGPLAVVGHGDGRGVGGERLRLDEELHAASAAGERDQRLDVGVGRLAVEPRDRGPALPAVLADTESIPEPHACPVVWFGPGPDSGGAAD